MDLKYSSDEEEFRDEVRTFLRDNLTPELACAGRRATSVYFDHEASMEWQEILRRRGWAAPRWPIEYGGCDWSPAQHYIFERESTLAGAPGLSPMGIKLVAPAIIKFGTQEQKDWFLPRILTGETFFCQGYSEPEAGSDLASLSMEAVEDEDHLICTGSKIWSTNAHVANWMFALVRTSQGGKKQHGITFLLVDMTSPGIEVQPIVMASGEQIQNRVFFEQVRVPKANILGQIDDGWSVAKYILEFERGGSAASAKLKATLDELVGRVATRPGRKGPLVKDPLFVSKLAALQIRCDVLEVLEYRNLARLSQGRNPGTASSMLKIINTELSQDITALVQEAAGVQGLAYQPHVTMPGGPVANYTPPADGYASGEVWQAVAPLHYLNDRAGTIYAGSNEIQRNILAKTELGL